MGQLSSTLEEFQNLSRDYYEKIIEILEDKYCWKCPQRSTSGKIWCREVDAWIRLVKSLEEGVNDSLNINKYSEEEKESITLNLLQKISKKSQKSGIYILRADKSHGDLVKENDLLLVSKNLQKARQGDLVLISEICPLVPYFQFKLDFTDFPFKIDRIKKITIKDRIRYMETEKDILMPVILLKGRIIKIISPDNPVYADFNELLTL